MLKYIYLCINHLLLINYKHLTNYGYINRSTVSRSQSVTSSQLLLNFAVKGVHVTILSVLNDKLLVSCFTIPHLFLVSGDNLSQLFIYGREGRHLSIITINDNDTLEDATWTPRGNIVYTTCYPSNKVVVMSESGKVITTHTQMTSPLRLSVSNDNIIYLANSNTGVGETVCLYLSSL